MSSNIRITYIIATVFIATLLIVACSSEPSPDDALAPEIITESSTTITPKRDVPPSTPEQIAAWGDRAKFFANLPVEYRPDIDWRSELTNLIANENPQWSQGHEELIIRDFFQDKRDGIFVDLGCAWPDRGSTSRYLESKLGWTGLAIDALPEYGPLWEEQRPDATFVSYAVSDVSGEKLTFYRHAWTGVSSLLKENSAIFGGEEHLTEIEVETITLDDLLPKHKISKIDHLTIDIEGAEMGALRGFDIERFLPELVCVETNDHDNVRAYFAAHGYELLERYRRVDKINSYFARKDAS